MRIGGEVERLVGIMARLRAPGGCPWDREQDLRSLRPYLVEECYEVLFAIPGATPRGAEAGHDLHQTLDVTTNAHLPGLQGEGRGAHSHGRHSTCAAERCAAGRDGHRMPLTDADRPSVLPPPPDCCTPGDSQLARPG